MTPQVVALPIDRSREGLDPSREAPFGNSGLRGAREALLVSRALDDLVAVAEAVGDARVAMLVPELGDPLLELLVLVREGAVVALGKEMQHLRAALGQAGNLLLDLQWVSHDRYNARPLLDIP
jgi:hypothetical protein